MKSRTHYPHVRRSARFNQDPEHYSDIGGKLLIASSAPVNLFDRKSHIEATARRDYNNFLEAMEVEIRITDQESVWTLADLPPVTKVTNVPGQAQIQCIYKKVKIKVG